MMMFRSCGQDRLAARLAWVIVIVGLACRVPGLAAQEPNHRPATQFYPDSADAADNLMRNAAGLARESQWAEAIKIYQRIIEQFGDKVARLPKDDPAGDPSGQSFLFVDLRQFCQRRIAALPPEARAIYRNRVDGQAERWYKQGAAERDRTLLRRVVEQAFCSSWGDDALDLLGDLAFQDGRFDEALALYRQLVPDRPADRATLSHPDPTVDLARVAAKKLLCRAALGESPPGRADLEAFTQAYPNRQGELAGRTGPYVKILAEALRLDHLAPSAQPDGRWPTFAGAPTRTKIVPGAVDVGSLQWRVDLPAVEARNQPSRTAFRGMGMGMANPTPTPPDRLLAYHPIVLGDQVVVCDENRIVAYNLNDRSEGAGGSSSGSIHEAWKRDETQNGGMAHATRNMAGVPRYTLTAFGDRIYARMGPTNWPHIGMRGMPVESRSYLIAVDRATEGKLLWKKQAVEITFPDRQADGPARTTGFEGTPVADARCVYAAMTDRREQTATYVVCLDAETGAQRWIRYLGAATSELDNVFGMGGFGMGMVGAPADFGHRLLTLDGPTVYYQTNLGAVAALDAETGRIRWVATYPRQERAGGDGHDRDLNPAIVHDGLVIVAPDDSNAIHAFDAASGRVVWKTDPIPEEVRLAHLLGVAKGQLVATGDRVLLFDVKSGNLRHTWPDSGRGYSGFGRGVLAGDKIYWPTRGEIHILDQGSGLRTDPPIKLQELFQTGGGNLAVGDGYLIVAQADSLVVFCQNSRLIERYRDEIARAPDQASNYYRLAQAAEAVGRETLALDALDQVLQRSRPSESIDGLPLADAARDHRHRLLMKLGQRARTAKDWAEAARRFDEAAQAARSDRDRLHARLLLASVQLDRGDAARAVDILQGLLDDDRARSLNVTADDGHRTVRANLLIADRLTSILRTRGRKLYAEYDRKARALLERGRDEKDARLLEEVGRSYPVALAVPESMLALGALHEGERRPAEAARAYKRLLASNPPDADRARALWGLARAYETQRLWVPAREAYLQAQNRFPDLPMEEFGTGMKLGSLVTQRLGREPFDRLAGDRSEPSLPVPLIRRWEHALPESLRPLAADGIPPTAESSRVFLAQGSTLRQVDPASGEPTWSAALGASPIWVGYLADKIIAATSTRLLALGLEKGTVEWQYDLGAAGNTRRGENPFAKDASGSERETAGNFHGFRIVGGRVFALVGQRKLVAFDGDTGLVDWSFAAPSSGTINPNLWIGPQRIVLQVRKPGAALVLETATGRRRAEFTLPEGEDWERDPLPIDDEHVALVVDRRTVELFDLKRGTPSWVFRESMELPRHGAPRLIGDAERLLVVHDGMELIRLDGATGVKQWSCPLGAEDLSERPEAMAVDPSRFYWVNERTLRAIALADGASVWERHLTGPESVWSIALTKDCVLAYPSLPGQSDTGETGLPLVFRRRDTGDLVQRLFFPAAVSDVAVRLAPRGVLVAAQGGLWSLGERHEGQGRKPGP